MIANIDLILFFGRSWPALCVMPVNQQVRPVRPNAIIDLTR